ncbi:MAG: class I SAM-dependent methyltransferase [Gaiellaceae bacterium]
MLLRNAVRAARRGRQIEQYLQTHDVRKLQLGAGDHPHPGWLNTDLHDYRRGDELVYLDVRKRFPLPDASFDLVFSEHVIEHLTYADGQHCLRECLRVLRPGGRIRIATPSLERLARLYDGGELAERYVRWAVDTLEPETAAPLPGVVVNNFFRSWGHRFIYDPDTLGHALAAAGFVDIDERPVGELERHLPEQPELNAYETFVLEARRPPGGP